MKIWGAKGDALADHQIGSDGRKSGYETDAVIRSFMTHSNTSRPPIAALRSAVAQETPGHALLNIPRPPQSSRSSPQLRRSRRA